MKNLAAIVVGISMLSLAGCGEDEPKLDPVTASLVSSLDEELSPLTPAPTSWADGELQFLDAFGDNAILGLGEATHGTSEFFMAKHRIFKYMVENHGFQVFAIEADVGESIFINEAVLAGDKSRINGLMKEKMHFWTWKTAEVRDMLYWMCDYNLGKPESAKLQYWGIDCQYNTYHPDMVRERLRAAQVSFLAHAEKLLDEAEGQADTRFAGYSQLDFLAYVDKMRALGDSIRKYDDDIISKISEKNYQLTLHLTNVVKQTAEVMYYATKSNRNYRDEYMADNTAWLHEYFDNAKVVLWAHNYHVSNSDGGPTTGEWLTNEFNDDYASIGFLFSKGTFRAVTLEGQTYKGLEVQKIERDPQKGSINEVMSHAGSPVFTVKVSALQGHDEWTTAFGKGMRYFQMGSVFNNKPEDYYERFEPRLFQQLIYFNNTTIAVVAQ